MKQKILFVDDEGDWRFMASSFLEDSGYEIITAKNGSEVVSLANGVPLDLIIMDINLAGEDGVALMEGLKTSHPEVPIILYTGHAHDDESVRSMIKKGAHAYLRKTTMQDLLKAVQGATK